MRFFLVLHLNIAVFMIKDTQVYERHAGMRAVLIRFRFGCGYPTQSNHQADNLAKLWQEFSSVIELIAKIFGAVSRTISLMRRSALLAIKRCRCRDDGFCSGFAFRNYSLLIIHYSLKKRHCGDGFCHFTMLPFLAD